MVLGDVGIGCECGEKGVVVLTRHYRFDHLACARTQRSVLYSRRCAASMCEHNMRAYNMRACQEIRGMVLSFVISHSCGY